MFFSLIIPVYNRPEDMQVVLDGLSRQSYNHFEVIVVESGSEIKSDQVVAAFKDRLDIHYYLKGNDGQGFSRNYGLARAKGDYLIILDSDIIIPSHYLQSVYDYLKHDYLNAFGGPDKAHTSFTTVQKAADFALTSYLTTGGTRGRKKGAGTYYPRSFNMGMSRAVYEKTKGFALPNCGEDIELSIRIQKWGFKTGLIPDAYVYHKRKDTLGGFLKQMEWFGKSRINLYRIYPESLKLMHLLPLGFYLYTLLMLVLLIVLPMLGFSMLTAFFIYFVAVFVEAMLRYQSIKVAAFSICTSASVFIGYGYGLIKYFFLQKAPYTNFPDISQQPNANI
ncbi:glycosyltransferase involved in cell wall biosynthesis [Catalinimonas alkaloidigena]|uniref:glycosyltransferase n=1 Tax=Catalinimonas alkaloidigena TaxID=1075417 RepID=UPI00240696C7|nr:glycosyltransferase [Catalinimonas alkaloidigena]MDF9795750.1 glycosyltransferase involved in cell wall biosynthesis [Catalinimonas alkaloidigena]